MAEGNSLINLGDFSKPVDTLITKISSAIGVLYEPKRIVNNAKAKAQADKIAAINSLEIEDLQKRALTRFVNEETIKQQNIESIIEKAIPEIKADAKAENVDNDWLVNFFDKSRLISNNDMQTLWSKILAGETNTPGAFSKMTLKVVDEMNKEDAEVFTKLCTFCFQIEKPTVIVNEVTDSIYSSKGITFTKLLHFERLGLLSFNNLSGFIRTGFPKNYSITYFDRNILFEFKNADNNDLPIGKILLSQAGEDLFKICNPQKDEEILSYCVSKWNTSDIKCVCP